MITKERAKYLLTAILPKGDFVGTSEELDEVIAAWRSGSSRECIQDAIRRIAGLDVSASKASR